LPRRRPAVDIVRDRFVLPVVDHGEVRPLAEALRRKGLGGVVVPALALRVRLHAQDDRAAVADLPVAAAGLPAVGHHQRVVEVGQRIDTHPGHHRQRIELARYVEAHTIADALELERLLAGPAPRDPGATDDGAVARALPAPGLVGQSARPGLV